MQDGALQAKVDSAMEAFDRARRAALADRFEAACAFNRKLGGGVAERLAHGCHPKPRDGGIFKNKGGAA